MLSTSMRTSERTSILLAFCGLLLAPPSMIGCGSEQGERRDQPNGAGRTIRDAAHDGPGRLIYVPAYIYAVDHTGRTPLTTTLTIHNTTFDAVTIHAVEYYDAAGALAGRQLDQPRELGPLETIEFHQQADGIEGKTGANFLIRWSGSPGNPPPLVEALMVGHQGTGRLTFTSRGVEVEGSPPDSRAED